MDLPMRQGDPPSRPVSRRIHRELPIFAVASNARLFAYAPGLAYELDAATLRSLERCLLGEQATEAPIEQLRQALCARAADAQYEWQQLAEKPFQPLCLTVYLSNRCNLGCRYCFSAPLRRRSALPLVSERRVRSAARSVAENCAKAGVPLTVVFHGGGEPTQHLSLLQRLVEATRQIAGERQIDWWGYVATNGVVSPATARWLAANFDLVGLSCDGPAQIHDLQRPTGRGQPTLEIVRRTAQVLAAAGTPLCVRATLTPESIDKQLDVVRFARETLGAASVGIEPAYHAGASPMRPFSTADADRFAASFEQALQWAADTGVDLQVSGVRPAELHGPYCHVLRDVLQISPDGSVSACFRRAGTEDDHGAELALSGPSQDGGAISVDDLRAAAIRRRATQIPQHCRDCFNMLHCARDCPDACLALGEGQQSANSIRGFRCAMQQHLGAIWIRANAHASASLA